MALYQGGNLVASAGGGGSKPSITAVTLTASGWDSTALTQTVTVTGLLADETKQILTHQQAETDQDEYNRADTEVHQVLHDDIAGIFGSGKAGFHHCKASLHPENQCRADQIPYTPYFTHNLTSL